MYYKSYVYYFTLPLFFICTIANSAVVDCDNGGSLAEAVNMAVPGEVISVSGVCNETIHVKTDDLVIDGTGDATISPLSPSNNAITVDGAVRVAISGMFIQNGNAGVYGKANASFTLKDLIIENNILGINLESGAHAVLSNINVTNALALGINVSQAAIAEIIGLVHVTGSGVFGINAQNNATVRVDKAELQLVENFLGGQFVVSSSLFVDQGKLMVNNNETIGLSINTGASAILFNANIETNNNGLDGLDTVSAANFDVDGTSTVTSNNNGRDGISIDDGTINLFGFFVGQNPGPKITANNNRRNGVIVELGGTLDIGANSSIEAKDNTAAGIAIDNGSTV